MPSPGSLISDVAGDGDGAAGLGQDDRAAGDGRLAGIGVRRRAVDVERARARLRQRAAADRVADHAGERGEVAAGVRIVVDLDGAGAAVEIDGVLDLDFVLGGSGAQNHRSADAVVAVAVPKLMRAVAVDVDGHLAAVGRETAAVPGDVVAGLADSSYQPR